MGAPTANNPLFIAHNAAGATEFKIGEDLAGQNPGDNANETAAEFLARVAGETENDNQPRYIYRMTAITEQADPSAAEITRL